MTEADFTQLVYARVLDLWTTTPVVYGQGKSRPTSPAESWIRVSVSYETSRVASLGLGTSGKSERRGRVFGQVFAVPAPGTDSGEKPSMDLAIAFRALFERRSLPVNSGDQAGFSTGVCRPQRVDGPWFQTNAEIPFVFHDTSPT